MSVDSILDGAFSLLLKKAQREEIAAALRPATIILPFSGGGVPPSPATSDPYQIEVPFPSRIVWAHMYAGDAGGLPVAVDATVDLLLSQFGAFGNRTPLYGDGAMPTLSGAFFEDLTLDAWNVNLDTGDTIMAILRTFSGAATWLNVSILIRPTDVPIGVSPVQDLTGNSVVDSNGNPVVMRS